jgi:hypothetical protein
LIVAAPKKRCTAFAARSLFLLAWLNPGLGLVAMVSAWLVIAEAGERWPANGTKAATQIARSADAPPSRSVSPIEACAKLGNLRLYD